MSNAEKKATEQRMGKVVRLTFFDMDRRACSLQKSDNTSLPLIRLGYLENYEKENRMHLSREQAALLIPYLQYFATTGDLP